MPVLHDRYGLPVGVASPRALDSYAAGVDAVLSANAGAEQHFAAAAAADPAMALAHIGHARSIQLAGRGSEARAAATRARALAGGLTRRERQHVEALALCVEGAPGALAAIRAHLSEFPRDAMVLAPATGVYGLIGSSGSPTRQEELLALLDGLAHAYGDDWWFLGAHGFALTEASGWRAGLPRVERSLALHPRNAHAAHALAHVQYERGGDADGAVFVRQWLDGYPREAQLHCHLSWHLALLALARGRPDEAWALYADSIRPTASLGPAFPTLVDGASLLWRAELAGEARRHGAWREVAAHARTAFPSASLTFVDAHCALAFAATGDREAMAKRVAELRHAAGGDGRAASAVTAVVAEGVAAYADGDDEAAIRLLEPAVDRFVQVGGSRAQRDVFEHTLLAAYWRSGRAGAAAALLGRRRHREPSVPVRRDRHA